jgi:mRNA interferase MazF
MTAYEFGDIVLVPFPFTDQTAHKKRPAVIVSSAAYHRDRQDFILLAITSQIKPSMRVGETFVKEWKRAGLLKPSIFKPVVTTVKRSLILRKLGRLTAEDLEALRKVLATILG